MKEGDILEIKKTAFTEQKTSLQRGKNIDKNVDLLSCDKVDIGKGIETKTFYEPKDFKLSPSDPDPNIIEGTNENFQEILKTSELPVMVDFYNPG